MECPFCGVYFNGNFTQCPICRRIVSDNKSTQFNTNKYNVASTVPVRTEPTAPVAPAKSEPVEPVKSAQVAPVEPEPDIDLDAALAALLREDPTKEEYVEKVFKVGFSDTVKEEYHLLFTSMQLAGAHTIWNTEHPSDTELEGFLVYKDFAAQLSRYVIFFDLAVSDWCELVQAGIIKKSWDRCVLDGDIPADWLPHEHVIFDVRFFDKLNEMDFADAVKKYGPSDLAYDEMEGWQERDEHEFLPWDDDEIMFVAGNWKIRRSHILGLYDYVIDGIEGSVPVDGFQLIEWNMAKPKTYEALSPWQGSAILIDPGYDVMRDLTDERSEKANRNYIVSENGKFVRCNRYYLVKNGMATATDKLIDKLCSGRPKLKKNDVILWEEDKLVIPSNKSCTIEKGARPGLYRVSRGGVKFNYTVARMREEGLGIDLKDYEINKLADGNPLKWADYREALHDFWMNAAPETITTVRDVAVVWEGLKDINNVNNKRISEHNAAIVSSLNDLSVAADNVKNVASKLDGKKEWYNKQLKAIDRIVSGLYDRFYTKLSFATNLTVFESKRAEFFAEVSRLEEWHNGIQAILTEENSRLSDILMEVVSVCGKAPFDVNCLPKEGVTDKMQKDYELACNLPESIKNSVTATRDGFLRKANELLDLDISLSTRRAKVTSVVDRVKAHKQRRAQLDGFMRKNKDSIDKDKKPGLFCKPHKEDKIAFTSNAKIKRTKEAHRYLIVCGANNTLEVSAAELVYMGLAEYKN